MGTDITPTEPLRRRLRRVRPRHRHRSMVSAPDPYDLGARAVAATIYRGRRDIAGDRVGWDQLTDSDKASCLALARPVVDAVETLKSQVSVAADKGGES